MTNHVWSKAWSKDETALQAARRGRANGILCMQRTDESTARRCSGGIRFPPSTTVPRHNRPSPVRPASRAVTVSG